MPNSCKRRNVYSMNDGSGRWGAAIGAALVVVAVIAVLGGIVYWLGLLPFEVRPADIERVPRDRLPFIGPPDTPVANATTEPIAPPVEHVVRPTALHVVEPTSTIVGPAPIEASPTLIKVSPTAVNQVTQAPILIVTPSPSPTKTPTLPLPTPTPPPIFADITDVSFVGTGYTLHLRIDGIPGGDTREMVRLKIMHASGVFQSETTQFMQIRNGNYIGAVVIDLEQLENSDIEWVKENITIQVIPLDSVD